MRMLLVARLTATWVAMRTGIKGERGATAVEYAVMVALIAAVIIAAVVFLGQSASTSFSDTGECLDTLTSC